MPPEATVVEMGTELSLNDGQHPSLVVITLLQASEISLRRGEARKIADLAGADLSPTNVLRLAKELLGEARSSKGGSRSVRALDRQARRLAERRSNQRAEDKAAVYDRLREVLSRPAYNQLIWPLSASPVLSEALTGPESLLGGRALATNPPAALEAQNKPPATAGDASLKKHPDWLRLRAQTRQDCITALMEARLPPGPEGLAAWVDTLLASALAGEDPLAFLKIYDETIQKLEAVARVLQPFRRMAALELILNGLGLRSRETQPVLRQWKKVSMEARHQKTEQTRRHREWERSLLNTSQVGARYQLKPVEIQRWTEQGLLPAARVVEFHKWGRDLSAVHYDPVVLDPLKDHFEAWREKDAAAVRRNRSTAAKSSSSRRTRTLKIKQCFLRFKESRPEWGARLWTDKTYQDLYLKVSFNKELFFGKNTEELSQAEPGQLPPVSVKLELEVAEALPLKIWTDRIQWLDLEEGENPFDRLIPALSKLEDNTQRQLAAAFEEVTRQYVNKLPPDLQPEVAHRLWELRLERTQQSASLSLSSSKQIIRQLKRVFEELSKNYGQEQRAYLLKEATGLGNFCGFFPRARALKRKFLFLAGPTNSGKSWRGFELLAKAATGVYLAPLRLLALEGQESLEGRGVSCHLVTGEERVFREGAQHTASTIEMLDIESEVEVALIDEVQLIADPDRGWAWTQACVGVPAPLVVLTGSAEVLPVVQKLVALTGDELEVQYLERLQPLHRLAGTVKLTELEKGDALIAFSRRDVLGLREELQALGRSVAVIYGALGPEVRRSEATRFRTGEAEILVATDAVGMGLNLPIRRVLFSTLTKFDGQIERKLTPAEIKQIAGRAGRYGRHEEGFVGVLEGASNPDLAAGLATPNPTPALRRFWVQPPWSAVRTVSEELNTRKLLPILEEINHRILREDSTWQGALADDGYLLVALVDRVALNLRDRFRYLGAPVDLRAPSSEAQFIAWLKGHASKSKVRAPELPPTASMQDLGTLEVFAKLLTAYTWLALRWPDVYCEETLARASLRETNGKLASALRAKSKKRQAPSRENYSGAEDFDLDFLLKDFSRHPRQRA